MRYQSSRLISKVLQLLKGFIIEIDLSTVLKCEGSLFWSEVSLFVIEVLGSSFLPNSEGCEGKLSSISRYT